MSKHEKLLEKLKQCSNTFEWSDLVTILTRLGYTLTEMEGSRVRFFNPEKDHMIRMHKPHPAYSHPSRTPIRNESEQSFARNLNTDSQPNRYTFSLLMRMGVHVMRTAVHDLRMGVQLRCE